MTGWYTSFRKTSTNVFVFDEEKVYISNMICKDLTDGITISFVFGSIFNFKINENKKGYYLFLFLVNWFSLYF